METLRETTTYYNAANILGADGVVANLTAVPIRYAGFVSIQCLIDDGAGGNPSDTPVGVWEVYSSANGTTYSKVAQADAELDRIKPNGNTAVDAFAIFEDMPGTSIKIRYKRTSGGGGNSRVRMFVTTW